MAEAIFAGAPQARLLATSREALRAEGEIVYRLAPLQAPSAEAAPRTDHALCFSAVQLFVERAASAAGFELCDVDAPVVSAICRHLDGVALAIELVAGRVAEFSLREVEHLLTTDIALTWPGLRTAPPRHRTLSATLNWSYALLSEDERTVLRRLSVFISPFAFDAALSVTAADGLTMTEAAQAIFGLIAKSLLICDRGVAGRYRMLNITRAFGLAKLAADDEEVAARLRHARHYLARLTAAELTATERAEAEVQGRAAREWTRSKIADPALTAELAGALGDQLGRQDARVAARGPAGRCLRLTRISPRLHSLSLDGSTCSDVDEQTLNRHARTTSPELEL